MRTVWKYCLHSSDVQTLEMPDGAEILTAQVQGAYVELWALVNPGMPVVPRSIRMAGTGHAINEPNLKYISTIQLMNGALVFHIFEVLP